MITRKEKGAKRSEPPDIFASRFITIPAFLGSQLLDAAIALLVFGSYLSCRLI